jgi:ribosomal protein S18 acetylase RimI-like enzyme
MRTRLLAAEMSAGAVEDGYSIFAGGAEFLDRVEPLWLDLRRHHAGLAPLWSASLLATSFVQRRAGLVAKAARGILVLLATSHGQDIAYCVSTLAADGTGEVDSLYVAPTHRRRGIAQALMTRTMDWFERQSVHSIVVDVLSGNQAAQAFYGQFGFLPRTVRLVRTSEGEGAR